MVGMGATRKLQPDVYHDLVTQERRQRRKKGHPGRRTLLRVHVQGRDASDGAVSELADVLPENSRRRQPAGVWIPLRKTTTADRLS